MNPRDTDPFPIQWGPGGPTPIVPDPGPKFGRLEPTDLEYREAALRQAIAFHQSKERKFVQEWEVKETAQFFEAYLRHG